MTIAPERQTHVAGELRHVNKWYGDHHVLSDVSVRISRGEIVALIGRSGSGKSTVLRVLAGLSTDHTGDRAVTGAGRAPAEVQVVAAHRQLVVEPSDRLEDPPAHQHARGVDREHLGEQRALAHSPTSSADRRDFSMGWGPEGAILREVLNPDRLQEVLT